MPLISLIIFLLTAAGVHAGPNISSARPACPDGFCVEIVGENLLSEGPIMSDKVGRYESSYINIYRGADRSARIGRVYRHEFLQAGRSAVGDTLSFRLPNAAVERVFVHEGVRIQVVNPEIDAEQKWSKRPRVFWDRNPVLICEDFDRRQAGEYSVQEIRKDFFSGAKGRGWIRDVAAEKAVLSVPTPPLPGEVDQNNQVLIVENAAGAWGPLGATESGGRTGGGLTFSSLVCASGDCNADGLSGAYTRAKGYEELFMSYWIRFEGADGGEFDFRRGGKLPGFAGGQTSVATGGGHEGVRPDGRNGWSARATFGIGGEAYTYLYYPENSNPVTETGRQYGENQTWMDGEEPFLLKSNAWMRILQRVRMNSIDRSTGTGRRDGVIQIWVDDKLVLDERRVRFRDSASTVHQPDTAPFHVGKRLDIDTVFFALFHGGGTPGHAPLKDVRYEIDDFLVFEPLGSARTQGCRR